MRVLHVSDRLTDRGGAYWHLLGVIAHQTETEEIHLAVGRADEDVRAPCDVTMVAGLDARDRQPVELTELVHELRPDVVHVHNVMNPEALAQAGRIENVTKVLTVQDHRVFCPGKGKWTEDGDVCSERMSAELCTQCFADAGYYREILALTRERFGALERFRLVVLSEYMKRELALPDVHVIPPFVHGLDLAAEADGPPCILFAGRLVESKGVLDAIEVWKRSGVEMPLVLAGTGTLRDDIEPLENVELLGWVAHERMASLYRRAAALVMPSRWQEPFGIVGLEAMTLGVPVVAWESGGISQWHPGPLSPWGDIDALASALRGSAGGRVTAPAGFDRELLMDRLARIYRN
jgi:glycosyltransferase involved in cell wall biosynthesis